MELQCPPLELESIESLDLTPRIQKLLYDEGIRNMQGLICMTECQLLRICNLGKKGVNLIKEALAKRNLTLS